MIELDDIALERPIIEQKEKKSSKVWILFLIAILLLISFIARGQPSPTTSTVFFAWNPVINATSYNLYVGTNSGIYFTNALTTNTNISVNTLQRGMTYYFVVTATANSLTSSYSSEISTSISNVPPVPTGFHVTLMIP